MTTRTSNRFMVSNAEGWRLAITRTVRPSRLVRGRNPVLIVPGYGMNSFIFSYHPRGLSMQDYLAEQGFEVWRADLRTQGEAVREGGHDRISLEDLGLTDVGIVSRTVLEHTQTGADHIDVVGASLGGTLMFLHVVAHPEHRFGSLVSMGAPVRWVNIPPALRLAFRSPTLIGLLPFRGSRPLARTVLGALARHAPKVLSLYMNPEITDTSAAGDMVKTVEDPNRHINKQIAHWIQSRDLIVRGRNVSASLGAIRQPFLCVVALGDGIVPRETAMYPYEVIGSPSRALIEVGDDRTHVAHADLFISALAQEKVFEPMSRWLADHAGAKNETSSRGAKRP